MKKTVRTLRYAVAALAVSALASTGTLTGVVTNGTTGEPVTAHEVVLISPADGVTETARANTDPKGRFSLTVPDTQAPPLVRVIHQGVAYYTQAPGGLDPVRVLVYEIAGQLDGVTALLGVQRFQTEGEKLQVVEQIVLRNASHPPRTLVNSPIEMQLPAEAELGSGIVQSAGGQMLSSKPRPREPKGRYRFPAFPLRPGETRFAVVYRLPYAGEAVIEPMILYPLTQFAVVLPGSMQFEAKNAAMFRPVAGKAEVNVQMAAAVKPGQRLAFRVSGTGTLEKIQIGDQQARPTKSARSAGGQRVPIELRDPPQDYRWFLPVGLALVLAAGAAGIIAHRRKQSQNGMELISRD